MLDINKNIFFIGGLPYKKQHIEVWRRKKKQGQMNANSNGTQKYYHRPTKKQNYHIVIN